MAENSGDLSLGYMMGQSESGGGFGNFGDGIWGILALLLVLGGIGGFGGNGGIWGSNGGDGVSAGFAWQGIDNGIRGVQQGLCDGFYAVNTSMLNGFHGVDNAICNLGYNMQQGFCSLGNVINMQTRDIIDNQNANYRGLMDFLVTEKLASKDARIAELSTQVSQSNQNAVIGARIDAAVAELLRRTGNECPTAAYLVQPPTPVNFPINGCGTVQFGGYGNGGCGCGF